MAMYTLSLHSLFPPSSIPHYLASLPPSLPPTYTKGISWHTPGGTHAPSGRRQNWPSPQSALVTQLCKVWKCVRVRESEKEGKEWRERLGGRGL